MGLLTGSQCSLKRSLTIRFVSSMYCFFAACTVVYHVNKLQSMMSGIFVLSLYSLVPARSTFENGVGGRG